MTAIPIFEALASGTRLDIFRLLVKAGPTGLVAGDIAAAMSLAPNNASFHLKALVQAGLLSVEPQGRYQRYRANMAVMGELVSYLTAECCNGQPAACALPSQPSCINPTCEPRP